MTVHTEYDPITKRAALRMHGCTHSRTYYVVRGWVRAAVCILPIVGGYAYATLTR